MKAAIGKEIHTIMFWHEHHQQQGQRQRALESHARVEWENFDGDVFVWEASNHRAAGASLRAPKSRMGKGLGNDSISSFASVISHWFSFGFFRTAFNERMPL